MHIFERMLVKQSNGKYLAVILKVMPNEPNCDTLAEKEFDDERDAIVWLDGELDRIVNKKMRE